MLIRPAGNPNMNESVRTDMPKTRPITEEKFMINIKNIMGKRMNSDPSPIKVHPSTFDISGSLSKFPVIKGIESNERIRIIIRIFICAEIEK